MKSFFTAQRAMLEIETAAEAKRREAAKSSGPPANGNR